MMDDPLVETVLDEQDRYRADPPRVLSRSLRRIARPVSLLTNRLVPADVIEAALRGADWAASATIRKAAVDHDLADLAACEAAAADVRRWALGFAVTGGGTAGAFGALGLAADVPATVTLAFRTARLTGLAYGYRAETEAERVFLLDILQLAGANDMPQKAAALAQLSRSRSAPDPEAWGQVVQMTGQTAGAQAAARRVAAILGVNLSTRKAAQIAPFIGAAIGAGVNAAFQNDVARAARYGFRERWLADRVGLIRGEWSEPQGGAG